jgi:hypothetical protein
MQPTHTRLSGAYSSTETMNGQACGVLCGVLCGDVVLSIKDQRLCSRVLHRLQTSEAPCIALW